jgi:hypothetical protein
MTKFVIYKIFGVAAGLASTIIAIRNLWFLSLGRSVLIAPDFLNGIELSVAIISIPAMAFLLWDLVYSEPKIEEGGNSYEEGTRGDANDKAPVCAYRGDNCYIHIVRGNCCDRGRTQGCIADLGEG